MEKTQYTIRDRDLEHDRPQGLRWVGLIRIAAWIVLIGMVIGTIYGSFTVFRDSILGGIFTLVVGIVGSFLSLSILFIFIDIAEDIAYSRRYLAIIAANGENAKIVKS